MIRDKSWCRIGTKYTPICFRIKMRIIWEPSFTETPLLLLPAGSEGCDLHTCLSVTHGFTRGLYTDIWEAAFPYTAHSSLPQFSLDISKPWLWGGSLPSPSVHCCIPNGAHGPPCGQSGVCLSLLYQMRKDEGRGEIKGKKTSLLQVSASLKAFSTFLYW